MNSELRTLDALRAIAPDIHRAIRGNFDNAIEDYLRQLMAPTDEAPSHQRDLGRRILAEAWCEYVGPRDRPAALAAIADLERAPSIFSGPHLQLGLDPSTFGTLALAHLAARTAGLRHCWVLFCAAVGLEMERYGGPGWLRFDGVTHNVFGLSRTVLRRHSILTLPGPVQYALEPTRGEAPTLPAKSILEHLEGQRFATASAAFHAANTDLWHRQFAPSGANPVLLDESFGAALIRGHLREPGSFVAMLLTDRDLLDHFVSKRREFDRTLLGPYNRFATDLFWFRGPRRLRRARVSAGRLTVAEDEDGGAISMTREDLVRGLEQGAIVPSLFVLYLAIGFLPGIRLIGGVRQMLYMRAFSDMFRSLWARAAAIGLIGPDIPGPVVRHGWATSLVTAVEPEIEGLLVRSLEEKDAFAAYQERVGGMTLRAASEDLAVLDRHPASSEAIRHLTAADSEPV